MLNYLLHTKNVFKFFFWARPEDDIHTTSAYILDSTKKAKIERMCLRIFIDDLCKCLRARNEIPSQLRTQHCQLHEMENDCEGVLLRLFGLRKKMSHGHGITLCWITTAGLVSAKDAKSLEKLSLQNENICKFSFYLENYITETRVGYFCGSFHSDCDIIINFIENCPADTVISVCTTVKFDKKGKEKAMTKSEIKQRRSNQMTNIWVLWPETIEISKIFIFMIHFI